MKKQRLLYFIIGFIIATILFFIIFHHTSCNWFSPKEPPGIDSSTVFVSWNVLFKPGTNKETRDRSNQKIKDFIENFYKNQKDSAGNPNPIETNIPDPVFCPCDTLLYNIKFDPIIGGVGRSVTTPVAGDVPTANGDYVGVANISENISIDESVQVNLRDLRDSGKGQYTQQRISPAVLTGIFPTTIDPQQILAIIDSGIDTTLFTGDIQKLIWRDSPGNATLFNFLPNQDSSDLSDRTSHKHGSAVAALALSAMGNISYPRLMILKALDSNNAGSIFSVSCALSYAVQKNATIINTSLGYYEPKDGAKDSILHHYISLTKNHSPSIELFASAGNTRGAHDSASLCKTPADSILLAPRLFYPACFRNDTLNNITTVTQLNNTGVGSCFYQNYSESLVSLGVLNNNTIQCCYIGVRFKDTIKYYEGTSFVTPIASGKKMRELLGNGNMVILKNSANKATIDGKYITFP